MSGSASASQRRMTNSLLISENIRSQCGVTLSLLGPVPNPKAQTTRGEGVGLEVEGLSG